MCFSNISYQLPVFYILKHLCIATGSPESKYQTPALKVGFPLLKDIQLPEFRKG